ncbi:sulfatase [bacterium]|nr:sulfatase [bacterium]
MKRRDFLKTAAATAGAAALPGCLSTQRRGRPNLVFVFADQLRADAPGYAGDTKAITSNLDRFAGQALHFTNAVSVMPVCAAFRGSLLTGKYPSSHGMVINELNMNPNHRTIAHVLGDAGYNLGYVGKWHLNDQHRRETPRGPERLGFDGFWAAYSFNHQSYQSCYFTDNEQGILERVDLTGKHGPTEFTSIALNYIEEAASKQEPFALFLSWNPPHDPWDKNNVPPESREKFKDVTFDLPLNFRDKPDPYMDRYPGFAFNGRESWKREYLRSGLQDLLRCYYAMIHDLDRQFGRLMKKLDQLGIADDTIVVFTSDHGEMFGSQGRMWKLTFYDEAARVPFLVRYPRGVKPGRTDICLNTPDIMPTLLGLLGLGGAIPAEVEGRNLAWVLHDKIGAEPEAAFLQGMGHTYRWIDGFEWRAVRDKRFTYARYLRDGKELLYDREEDPFCMCDVSGDAAYAGDLERLRCWMQSKMAELNDEFLPCTWYRDHWMYKEYSITAGAKGEFGPLPPVEPRRK